MQHDRIDPVLSDWSRERPDLSTESLALALRLQSLAKSMADNLTEVLSRFDLEWWEYDVLSVLRRQGSPYQMSASDIGANTRLSGGAVTNRIDGLVDRSFVERIADPKDRRRVLVQLLESGQQIVDRATSARFQNAEHALECLTDTEQSQLNSLLRKLVIGNEISLDSSEISS